MKNIQDNIEIINDFVINKDLVLTVFQKESNQNGESSHLSDFNKHALLVPLLSMHVTTRNKFSDDEWDYNQDVLNPQRSVVGAKLRINFTKYEHIPAFVIIELKCLLHYFLLTPSYFRKVTEKHNKRVKKNIKPNTAISHFESGLRYINTVFENMNIYGKDFVQQRYKSLSDVLDSDFRKGAEVFTFTADNSLKRFLSYLNHPNCARVLGEVIKVDLSNLPFPEKEIKKRKEKLVFDNRVYERLINHSTYKVVDFLNLMGQEVEDKIALKHHNVLSFNAKSDFKLSSNIFNDYVLIRLWTKGYPQSYIEEFCTISSDYLNSEGKLIFSEEIRKKAKKKYDIKHFDHIRREVNEVYYASAFLIAQYTGMRPGDLSEICLRNCLVVHEGFDLIVSNMFKGKFENLKLFDDKWVAIPIMKDAIRVARQISILKNNDYLFSNMDTVKPNTLNKSMGPQGIKEFFTNYLNKLFDKKTVEEINFTPYMTRHTLAYQLHRAELGLPFISFQLKHVVDRVGKYSSVGASSSVTLGYGEIAENIVTEKANKKELRHLAELERIKSVMNPDGTYLGPKGKEHKLRLKKIFTGYIESGYTKDQVFDAMAKQGIAVINVGSGFCFGGIENYDESLPCIGSLRCNPIRCSNAIVTEVNAPKWREVLITNQALLAKEGYEDRKEQILATIKEAQEVLKLLGQEVII